MKRNYPQYLVNNQVRHPNPDLTIHLLPYQWLFCFLLFQFVLAGLVANRYFCNAYWNVENRCTRRIDDRGSHACNDFRRETVNWRFAADTYHG